MKRWLVVLIVVLALVVLVSPGIIGRLAEDNVEQGVSWTMDENPGVRIATESFQRKWFTSEGRYRVVFEGGQFREARDAWRESTGAAEMPSLIIDTHLDHGPVPLASLGREDGSLVPALADAVSTFRIDPGNGETIALPATLNTRVGFDGASRSHFLLEPGSQALGADSLKWEGADLSIDFDPAAGRVAARGTVSPWSGTDGAASFEVGAITIDVDQTTTDFGFGIGPANVAIDGLTFNGGATPISVGRVSFASDSSLDGGRVDSNGRIEVGDVQVPGFGNVAVVLAGTMTGFDGASFGGIVDKLRETRSADDQEAALQRLMPQLESDLRALANAGGNFTIDDLRVTLPQGDVHSSLSISVPQGSGGDDFSWPGVLLATKASMTLSVPEALFDMVSMMNPQASALVAMGILVKEGEDYVMSAEYAEGLVSVNGAPMPLPLPGI